MKTNLLRIGLRLSLVVILLCSAHLAWGQVDADGSITHSIKYQLENVTLEESPSTISNGNELRLKIHASGDYRLPFGRYITNNVIVYMGDRDVSPYTTWDGCYYSIDIDRDGTYAELSLCVTDDMEIRISAIETFIFEGFRFVIFDEDWSLMGVKEKYKAEVCGVASKKQREYNVPDKAEWNHQEYPVVSIWDAFYGCSSATTLRIGKNVRMIDGYYTYLKCESLEKVYFLAPEPTMMKSSPPCDCYVPKELFYDYCMVLPSVYPIDAKTFPVTYRGEHVSWQKQYKNALENTLLEVTWTGENTAIGTDSYSPSKYVTVSMGDKILEEGTDYSYSRSTYIRPNGMGTIKIPRVTDSVTITVQMEKMTDFTEGKLMYHVVEGETEALIGSVIEKSTSKENSLVIPAHVRNYTVTAIYDNAFVGEILRSLTIPSSVREVGSGIFEATQIDTVYLKSTTPPVLKDKNICWNKECVLCVPTESLKSYQGWGGFTKIIGDKNLLAVTHPSLEHVIYIGPEEIMEGETFNAKLTPESGYVLGIGDITVTMGGKKLDPMSKEFFYGTFGKDTLTIETVTGDVTITAKARKISGDPFVLGDLTYRITRDAAVEVAGVKEDAYTKGRSYVIPSSLEYEGNNYTVTGIGPKAFSGRIMESIMIPSSVEEVGTESFLDAQADEIHIQRSTSPSTVNGSFNILDKNKCRIYVPKGALAAYHTATWDWLGFPYILEEGDKYFDVDFELTGLTVKPFQPEIVISGRSLSFTLVPEDKDLLPEAIQILLGEKEIGAESYTYDAKTGEVIISTISDRLTIEAHAIGALLPKGNENITIGSNSTYSDGTTVDGKFNGVIGSDEKPTEIKSLNIETDDGATTAITLKALAVMPESTTSPGITITETSNIEITLDGNNNLGKVLNQGSTRLLPGENTLLDALVENEGVFIDETGLLDAVTGPAGLTIAQRPEKAPRIEMGSSMLLKVEASAEGEANLSYIWEKFDSENNSWKQVKPEVQRTKALSSLRSDVLSTNEDTQLEVSEVGKYRCLVSNTVNAVTSTLTAYSEVSIASSTPDPIVTFSVTLPSVEGAALNPLAGTYSVEAGGSFSFSLTLDTDYDQSTPMVKVGDKLIEPTSDGKYEIKNINSDITISITGIVKNATVGNAEVESNALKIWGSNGVLHIQSAHVSTAYIMTFGGQLYKALTLPIGETMITIPQGAYIIRIENQSYKIRF